MPPATNNIDENKPQVLIDDLTQFNLIYFTYVRRKRKHKYWSYLLLKDWIWNVRLKEKTYAEDWSNQLKTKNCFFFNSVGHLDSIESL